MRIFKEIFTKRFITRVQKNYPSIFFCIFLILGQLFSFYLLRFNKVSIVILITSLLIFFIIIKKFIFLNFFIIGMLSFYIGAKEIETNNYADDTSFLVKIISPIQNKVPNKVTFDVKVIGVQKEEPKSIKKINYERADFLMHCSAIYLPWKNVSNAKTGDILAIVAKTKNVEFTLNPFSYNAYLLRKSISKTCNVRYANIINHKEEISSAEKLNFKIRENIVNILGDNESSGLFLSMTIGVRNLLAQSTEDKFKKTGLTHLLVVSGYQVCLIYFTIMFLIKELTVVFKKLYYFFFLQYIYKIIALSGSIFFVLVSGCDSSSIRAGLAIIILNIANIFEKNNSFANSIILSFFIMHLMFPLCVLDPGVALSYAALVGIWLGSFAKNKIKCFLMVSFYTYITTGIITLIWFNQISFISFLLNILVAPIISWISCNLGFLAIFLSFTFDKGGYFVKGVSFVLDNFKFLIFKISELNYISHVFESLPILLVGILSLIVVRAFLKRIRYYVNFWGL